MDSSAQPRGPFFPRRTDAPAWRETAWPAWLLALTAAIVLWRRSRRSAMQSKGAGRG